VELKISTLEDRCRECAQLCDVLSKVRRELTHLNGATNEQAAFLTQSADITNRIKAQVDEERVRVEERMGSGQSNSLEYANVTDEDMILMRKLMSDMSAYILK
jgi:hypothetical protein